MGYGIHVEEETEEKCTCPLCVLGRDSYEEYMRTLAGCNMVEDLLAIAPPDAPLIDLGIYGLKWFIAHQHKLGVPDEVGESAVMVVARAFAKAMMDTALKIRKGKE